MMKTKIGWPLWLMTLGVAACASGPQATPALLVNGAVEVPARWQAGSGAWSTSAIDSPSVLAARWWQRFGDEDLQSWIAQALQENANLSVAQGRLRAARAAVALARAGQSPSVGAQLSAQRSRKSEQSSSLYQAGFDASWEPDVFGELDDRLRAAEAQATSSEATLAMTRVSLAAEVAASALQWRRDQQRLSVARAQVGALTQTAQIAQWRLQAGLGSSLDVLQAATALEQVSAQIPALESSIDTLEHAMSVLMGRAPQHLSGMWAQARAKATGVPTLPEALVLSIPAETLRQRPDVKAAEADILAASAQISAAQAARLPSFSLSGSVGLQALTWGALGSSGAVVGALLGGVSASLYDAGAGAANVESQRAGLDVAQGSYRATVLAALQDVEDALVNLRGAQARVSHLSRGVASATEAADLAQVRYTAGLIDFATVLETQRTALTLQDSILSAQADVALSQVQLFKALGGGWEPSAAPTPSVASSQFPSGVMTTR